MLSFKAARIIAGRSHISQNRIYSRYGISASSLMVGMIISSRFAGDTNQTLKLVQHDLYDALVSYLFTYARERYLSATSLVGKNTVLSSRIAEVAGLDHRVLQEAHDVIAAHFRYAHDTGQVPLFIGDDGYPEFLRKDWCDFFHREAKNLAGFDEIALAILEAVAYQNTPRGYTAEENLVRKLISRYGDPAESPPLPCSLHCEFRLNQEVLLSQKAELEGLRRIVEPEDFYQELEEENRAIDLEWQRRQTEEEKRRQIEEENTESLPKSVRNAPHGERRVASNLLPALLVFGLASLFFAFGFWKELKLLMTLRALEILLDLCARFTVGFVLGLWWGRWVKAPDESALKRIRVRIGGAVYWVWSKPSRLIVGLVFGVILLGIVEWIFPGLLGEKSRNFFQGYLGLMVFGFFWGAFFEL